MTCEEREVTYSETGCSPETSERSYISNESLTGSISDSSSSNPSRSSITVRTLEESINGIVPVKAKRTKRWRSKSLSSDSFKKLYGNNRSSSERRSTSLNNETFSKFLSEKRSPSERKSVVQFSDVMIHEHAVIPGDNPSVRDGPPLSIDWTAFNDFSVPVNTFEEFREGNRRSEINLRLPTEMRTAFLLQEEHGAGEIAIATGQAAASRQQRLQTIKCLRLHTLESLAI